jgi:hypothetical protein
MGLDPREYDMPALISTRLQQRKAKSDVPDASDAEATMKYWDEYRRKERLRIAGEMEARGIVTDDGEHGALLNGDELHRLGFTIGEMPTVRTLWERELTNHLEDIYQNGAKPDMVLLTPEIAFEHGVISRGRFQWLKFLRFVKTGTWKPRGSSGGQSARRKRGM